MTLLERLSAWWRRATLAPDPTRVVPIPPPALRVPAEYVPLYTYLEHRHASTVVLTFEQMESILGFPLPDVASTQRDWWMGIAVRTARHSDAWTQARRTAAPNLSAGHVTFESRS